MTRLFKPAALVAVGMLFGGVLTVGAVTTTDPITLCIRNGSVRVADTGSCTSKETAVHAASAEDVAALASRMDTDEAAMAALQTSVQAQQAVIDELVAEVLPGELTVANLGSGGIEFSGKNLEPGSEVTGHYRDLVFGVTMEQQLQVASDGTFYHLDQSIDCENREVELWASGTGRSGEAVESTHISC